MRIKSFVLILTLILIAHLGFTLYSKNPDKEKKYPSVYKEGIVVNGNSSEWDNSLFSFNKQAQVNYSIVNDTAAIYVCVRIADEAAQMKILHNGMELRFNGKGKKKAEATIHFPIGGKPDASSRLNVGIRTDRKKMQLMFLLQMQDMELSGFKTGVNGFQNVKSGKNGMMAAINWDSTNVMVYEARIPFTAFTGDVRLARPLAVGIIVKAAPKPQHTEGEGSQDPTMQNPGQGGGMRPGGGRNMQGSMQEHGDMRNYEDDEIWRFITIAKKD
jgi:hypothetical protein